MELFRIQHPENNGGAWFNEDGTDNRTVDQLTNKALACLPMSPEHDHYHRDGKQWQCAAWSVDHLKIWFNDADTAELIAKGFKLAWFIARDFEVQQDRNQVIFLMDTVETMVFFDSYDELEAFMHRHHSKCFESDYYELLGGTYNEK